MIGCELAAAFLLCLVTPISFAPTERAMLVEMKFKGSSDTSTMLASLMSKIRTKY